MACGTVVSFLCWIMPTFYLTQQNWMHFFYYQEKVWSPTSAITIALETWEIPFKKHRVLSSERKWLAKAEHRIVELYLVALKQPKPTQAYCGGCQPWGMRNNWERSLLSTSDCWVMRGLSPPSATLQTPVLKFQECTSPPVHISLPCSWALSSPPKAGGAEESIKV